MRKIKLFMLAVIIFLLFFVLNCENKNTNINNIPTGTNIVFRDDFNKGATPNSFWTLCRPEVNDDNDPAWNRFLKITEGYECVRVEDGYLKLTAKKETGSWTNIDKKTGGVLHYKTGGVYSGNNRFGVGTSLKVRAKLYQEEQAKTNGFYVPSAFPAIWYYPLYSATNWPAQGEIDIMEWVNVEPESSYSTLHYKEMDTMKNKSAHQLTKINVAEWHIYRCDIYNNNIVWYYDDKEIFRHTNSFTTTYPFNENHYNIILNASLSKSWGTPVEEDDSNLPYEMWVDWVEVSLIDKETGKPL